MLYLSRRVGMDKWGVVDTDDDVEEVVAGSVVGDAVLNHNIQIRGAELVDTPNGKFIKRYTVYQDMRYCTQLQARTKTLLGIDVRVYKDEIVHISVDGKIAKAGTRLRLSDFGHSMSWHAQIRLSDLNAEETIVLVLDDTVKMLYTDMMLVTMSSIRWDISECTDEEFVAAVYNNLMTTNLLSISAWGSFLIDTEERTNLWIAAALVRRGQDVPRALQKKLFDLPYWDDICQKVGDMFKSDFARVANFEFKFSEIDMRKAVPIVQHYGVGPFSVQHYDKGGLRNAYLRVFQLLRNATSSSIWFEFSRFENYLRYFDASVEVKQLFVDLCNRFVQYVQQYAESEGIIL